MGTDRLAAMRKAETVVTNICNQKVVVEVQKLKDMIVMSMPAWAQGLVLKQR